MWILAIAASVAASEYQAPDGSFRMAVPTGWKARYSAPFTVLEQDSGAKMLLGSGVALTGRIQELSQQAVALTAQMFPGARLASGPKFREENGLPAAEQEYQNGPYAGWNGMLLKNGPGADFYFAVLAIGPLDRLPALRTAGQQLLHAVKFDGLARNPRLEAALLGTWSKSAYTASRTGVRNKSNYTSNWTVQYLPGNRFVSVQQNYFDTENETYGGGSVGSNQRATGGYRIFGSNTLVADIDAAGRQVFALEFYPNGAGVKVNGQLFLRE